MSMASLGMTIIIACAVVLVVTLGALLIHNALAVTGLNSQTHSDLSSTEGGARVVVDIKPPEDQDDVYASSMLREVEKTVVMEERVL